MKRTGPKNAYPNIIVHDFDMDNATIQVKNVFKPYPKSPTIYIIIKKKRLNIWIRSVADAAAAVFKVTI